VFLDIKNLSKYYNTGNGKFKALDNVSFEIEKGKIAVVLGPSGSGKSTLINIIGGIDAADEGKVIVDGKDITKYKDNELTEYRRENIGFVFQFYNLIPNLTVYENIEISANICDDPMRVETILDAVGMKDMQNRFPRELSGGQQQRVSIARAIVKKPKILLCDEPTGALDYKTSKEILKLVSDVNRHFNTTVMIITHNQAIADMAHKVIRLRSGVIVEDRDNLSLIPAERIEW
jgi:putative ABC transport system ATP-binding protein